MLVVQMIGLHYLTRLVHCCRVKLVPLIRATTLCTSSRPSTARSPPEKNKGSYRVTILTTRCVFVLGLYTGYRIMVVARYLSHNMIVSHTLLLGSQQWQGICFRIRLHDGRSTAKILTVAWCYIKQLYAN